MMLFFTGFARTASDIAPEQIQNIPTRASELHRMMEIVDAAMEILTSKGDRIEDFGRLLDEQWQIKQRMSARISNREINAIYDQGIAAGALGGKLLGAGGGGFMLLLVSPERQAAVKDALKDLLYVPCRFDHLGSQIVYHSHEDEY